MRAEACEMCIDRQNLVRFLVPVSAYVESSKKLKDLKDADRTLEESSKPSSSASSGGVMNGSNFRPSVFLK